MLREAGLHNDELLALFLSSFEPTVCLWPEYRHSLPDTIPYHLNWSTTSNLPEPYRTQLNQARDKWHLKRDRIIDRLTKLNQPIPDDLELGWIRLNTRTVYLDQIISKRDDSDSTANWALVPFLDCLNHSSAASTKTRIVNDRFELITEKGVEKDEQVFISYGQHSDTFLLIEYGFVIGSTNRLNYVDFLPIDIIDHVSTGAGAKRAKVDVASVAKEYGCDSGLGVDCNGPTWSLVRFVACASLSRGQLKRCVYETFDEWPDDVRAVVVEQMMVVLKAKMNVFNAAKTELEEPVLVCFLQDQLDLLSRLVVATEHEWN